LNASGHGIDGNDPLDQGMPIQQQATVLDRFRRGEINLLVATKVIVSWMALLYHV